MATPVHADDPRELALCEAIRSARSERMTQTELGERLGVKQSYVSRWEIDYPPQRATVARIEEALDLPAGTLMREAGYAEGLSVEDAIRSDLRLTPANQQMLLNAYRVALRESSKSRKAAPANGQAPARSSTLSLAGSSRPSRKVPQEKRTKRTS